MPVISITCFSNVNISNEAEFQIDSPDPPATGIPPAVLKRCFGKQRPIAPHCQRLLMAARKEIKAPAKAKAKAKGKAKAKAKAKGGGKGKGNRKGSEQSNDPSAYATAKAQFMEQSLVSNIGTECICIHTILLIVPECLKFLMPLLDPRLLATEALTLKERENRPNSI